MEAVALACTARASTLRDELLVSGGDGDEVMYGAKGFAEKEAIGTGDTSSARSRDESALVGEAPETAAETAAESFGADVGRGLPRFAAF